MKIINVLLMGLLTCIAGKTGIKAQPVCPSGYSCVCNGACLQCGEDLACDCTCDNPGCCPSSVVPFTPHENVLYTLSSGAYFICDSSNKNLKPILVDEGNNSYTCSDGSEELPHKEFKENLPIKVKPGVIYSFPSRMVFRCDKTPILITGASPVNGLPSQYYICPVMSGEKTELEANK